MTANALSKVIHRHRSGNSTFRRVSELVFVSGRPKAVLGRIDAGGVRTPIYIWRPNADGPLFLLKLAPLVVHVAAG